MTHDNFCDLLLATCDARDFRHDSALKEMGVCFRCNRICDCQKLAKVRADERERIKARMEADGAFEGPAIYTNGQIFVPYSRVEKLVMGGEQGE